MENYIRVYENVVSDNWCDALVQKFEDFDDCHEVINNKMSFKVQNDRKIPIKGKPQNFIENILENCFNMSLNPCKR